MTGCTLWRDCVTWLWRCGSWNYGSCVVYFPGKSPHNHHDRDIVLVHWQAEQAEQRVGVDVTLALEVVSVDLMLPSFQV